MAPHYDSIMTIEGKTHMELNFWEWCANKYGDPVLEVGCGTGRIMSHLLLSGYRVDGIDLSPEMLQLAKSKLINTPGMKDAPRWNLWTADMRSFKLPYDYSLIAFGASQFLHLKNMRERSRCLWNVRKHMKDKGVCVITATSFKTKKYEAWCCVGQAEETRYYRRLYNSSRIHQSQYKVVDTNSNGVLARFSWTLHNVTCSSIRKAALTAGLQITYSGTIGELTGLTKDGGNAAKSVFILSTA